MQTSTITVAILKEPSNRELIIQGKDIDIKTCRGSGNGGQHRNKTDSAVIVKHIPTQTTVRCEAGRSQFQNRETALKTLRAILWKKQEEKIERERSLQRNSQIGSGMRGDKRRTIRVQHGVVEDHVTGKTWRYEDYRRGDWGA